MKLLRVLIAAFAALALALPLAGAATASPAKAKLTHTFVESITQPGNKILFHVKVKGQYANGRTVLQKATCKTCKFHDYAKKRTNANGKVVYTLDAPKTGRWYWRVYTPKTVKYKISFSRVAYTYQI